MEILYSAPASDDEDEDERLDATAARASRRRRALAVTAVVAALVVGLSVVSGPDREGSELPLGELERPRLSPPPPSPSPPSPTTPTPPTTPPQSNACLNSCQATVRSGAERVSVSLVDDGACDDGGVGSLTRTCALGTDCADCGVRMGHAVHK
jgi:hypothetical protein